MAHHESKESVARELHAMSMFLILMLAKPERLTDLGRINKHLAHVDAHPCAKHDSKLE
jgi:hypothetical protein